MNQQAKEKAPQTAATAQGAKNNVQSQSTANQAESQALLRDKLDEAALDMRFLPPWKATPGMIRGLWLLAPVAYRRADELSKEEEDASNA